MLNHISWSSYFQVAGLLSIAFYLFVAYRYYRDDIRRFLSRISGVSPKKSINEALLYCADPETDEQNPSDSGEQTLPIVSAAEQLTKNLQGLISASSEESYAPLVLIAKLRQLFRQYASSIEIPDRKAIATMVLAGCEKTGVAALTEEEVEKWWED